MMEINASEEADHGHIKRTVRATESSQYILFTVPVEKKNVITFTLVISRFIFERISVFVFRYVGRELNEWSKKKDQNWTSLQKTVPSSCKYCLTFLGLL